MKTAISIIIFLIVCAMIAGTEISFNPFRIRFHEWEKLVGYILLIFSFFFLTFSSYKNGYERGYRRGSEHVIEILKERQEQKKAEKNNEHLSQGTEV